MSMLLQLDSLVHFPIFHFSSSYRGDISPRLFKHGGFDICRHFAGAAVWHVNKRPCKRIRKHDTCLVTLCVSRGGRRRLLRRAGNACACMCRCCVNTC